MQGPRLVIIGSVIAAVVLSAFLYTISLGAAYPDGSPAVRTSQQQPSAPPAVMGEPVALDQDQVPASLSAKDCTLSSNFPERILQWCELITHYANKRGLPPNLVAAVILQESGGSARVISGSGAVGLMQVMPSDGVAASFQCINGPCFSNRPTIKELEDPEFNISYGTKMLSRLTSRHGSFREALKSYGPMNMGYVYADKVLGLYERYAGSSG